jgi:hypothetical protein
MCFISCINKIYKASGSEFVSQLQPLPINQALTLRTPTMADPNLFVKAMAFTKTAHRDIYPAVQPTRPELSQSGKVIVITGATRGLGRVSTDPALNTMVHLSQSQALLTARARASHSHSPRRAHVPLRSSDALPRRWPRQRSRSRRPVPRRELSVSLSMSSTRPG